MLTIQFESREQTPPDTRQFRYSVEGRTWLLLAGFLPTEFDDDKWINHYTGVIAITTVGK